MPGKTKKKKHPTEKQKNLHLKKNVKAKDDNKNKRGVKRNCVNRNKNKAKAAVKKKQKVDFVAIKNINLFSAAFTIQGLVVKTDKNVSFKSITIAQAPCDTLQINVFGKKNKQNCVKLK